MLTIKTEGLMRVRTQIAFDIDRETRNLVKIAAIRRNISMNLWINRAIYKELVKEGMVGIKEKIEAQER